MSDIYNNTIDNQYTNKDNSIKYQDEFKIIFERVRFENDDRTLRPLIIIYSRKLKNFNNLDEEYVETKVFFVIFDFYEERIVCKIRLLEPELVANNNDQNNIQRTV